MSRGLGGAGNGHLKYADLSFYILTMPVTFDRMHYVNLWPIMCGQQSVMSACEMVCSNPMAQVGFFSWY